MCSSIDYTIDNDFSLKTNLTRRERPLGRNKRKNILIDYDSHLPYLNSNKRTKNPTKVGFFVLLTMSSIYSNVRKKLNEWQKGAK